MTENYVATRVKALSSWDQEKDTCSENPEKHMKWTNPELGHLPYEHGRPLPKSVVNEAIKYISTIISKYPFQLRYAMAMPLWDRFCDEWCLTGDEKKALLAI